MAASTLDELQLVVPSPGTGPAHARATWLEQKNQKKAVPITSCANFCQLRLWNFLWHAFHIFRSYDNLETSIPDVKPRNLDPSSPNSKSSKPHRPENFNLLNPLVLRSLTLEMNLQVSTAAQYQNPKCLSLDKPTVNCFTKILQ